MNYDYNCVVCGHGAFGNDRTRDCGKCQIGADEYDRCPGCDANIGGSSRRCCLCDRRTCLVCDMCLCCLGESKSDRVVDIRWVLKQTAQNIKSVDPVTIFAIHKLEDCVRNLRLHLKHLTSQRAAMSSDQLYFIDNPVVDDSESSTD
jgi:hypothetical protein